MANEKELTLEEFEDTLTDFKEKFVANYRNGMATQPDLYSSSLTEADWWEQFAAFEGLQNG